jgi:hypothetical protein
LNYGIIPVLQYYTTKTCKIKDKIILTSIEKDKDYAIIRYAINPVKAKRRIAK